MDVVQSRHVEIEIPGLYQGPAGLVGNLLAFRPELLRTRPERLAGSHCLVDGVSRLMIDLHPSPLSDGFWRVRLEPERALPDPAGEA